jgi:hypothetical protein
VNTLSREEQLPALEEDKLSTIVGNQIQVLMELQDKIKEGYMPKVVIVTNKAQ